MRYTYLKPRHNVSQAAVRQHELTLDLMGLITLLLLGLLLYQTVL